MADDCVFCSIVDGTAPAERVYENDVVVAIMDIHPAAPGHVLLIPRTHSQDLWHIQRQDAEQTMAAAVEVAGMIRRALDPAGINLVHATGVAAWQSVFHVHLHLVPGTRTTAWSHHGRSTSPEQKMPACVPSPTGFGPRARTTLDTGRRRDASGRRQLSSCGSSTRDCRSDPVHQHAHRDRFGVESICHTLQCHLAACP